MLTININEQIHNVNITFSNKHKVYTFYETLCSYIDQINSTITIQLQSEVNCYG